MNETLRNTDSTRSKSPSNKIIHGDSLQILRSDALTIESLDEQVGLTFLDPPFNQNKEYAEHSDDLPSAQYWNWMEEICTQLYQITSQGGAIYFMQREKNAEYVLRCLRESGWYFQNLIIWKKKTSAVPGNARYGKHYQIIAYATKGERPKVFHRLRIDPPLPIGYKYQRENGIFVTDVWDDIRELTAGYFAGDEALRDSKGNRIHKQQAPLQLLVRIILSSSKSGDIIFDLFAGTGTTAIAAEQLHRRCIAIELDKKNIEVIGARLSQRRDADDISNYIQEYKYTEHFQEILGMDLQQIKTYKVKKSQMTIFETSSKS